MDSIKEAFANIYFLLLEELKRVKNDIVNYFKSDHWLAPGKVMDLECEERRRWTLREEENAKKDYVWVGLFLRPKWELDPSYKPSDFKGYMEDKR